MDIDNRTEADRNRELVLMWFEALVRGDAQTA